MMEKCDVCGTPLINGTSTANALDYSPEDLDRICNNVITPEELYAINVRTPQYYYRTRLCPNKGNNDFTVPAKYKGISEDEAIAQSITRGDTIPINPPCPKYHGGDTSKPSAVVETIKIIDN